MKNIDIFDDEDSLQIEDDFSIDTFDLNTKEKKLEIRTSIKDDCFFITQVIEYKINSYPIEIYMRTIEKYSEPPIEYTIKDGVVLESQLIKKEIINEEMISDLKKSVEWKTVPIFSNYEVNLFILSRHPEILSKEEFNKFLRQSSERIKLAIHKIEDLIKNNAEGLQIITGDFGKTLWYPKNILDNDELKEYWSMTEEDKKKTKCEKKFKYAEDFSDKIFDEKSKNYVGITKYEFEASDKILKYIEDLIDKPNLKPVTNLESEIKQKNNMNKNISVGIYLITISLILLKLSEDTTLSWFSVFLLLLLWEGLGFIRGFLGVFRK